LTRRTSLTNAHVTREAGGRRIVERKDAAGIRNKDGPPPRSRHSGSGDLDAPAAALGDSDRCKWERQSCGGKPPRLYRRRVERNCARGGGSSWICADVRLAPEIGEDRSLTCARVVGINTMIVPAAWRSLSRAALCSPSSTRCFGCKPRWWSARLRLRNGGIGMLDSRTGARRRSRIRSSYPVIFV